MELLSKKKKKVGVKPGGGGVVNNSSKKVPRYFDKKVINPADKTNNKKPKKNWSKGKGEEAIDNFNDDSGNSPSGEIDAAEISAFVNKLGLDKFSSSAEGGLSNNKKKDVLSKEKDKQKKEKKNKVKGGSAVNIENGHHDSSKSSAAGGAGLSKSNSGPPFPSKSPEKNNNGLKNDKKNKNSNNKFEMKKKGKGVEMMRQKQGPKLIVRNSGSKWYQEEGGQEEEQRNQNEADKHLHQHMSQNELSEIQKQANSLLEEDVQAYRRVNNSGSNRNDYQWVEKVMKTGTLPDRMAAFTVKIQDSPVHNLNILQQLISLVKVQGKQQCLIAADTLRDLFLEDLLPPDRKLIPFASREASSLKSASKKDLIRFMFEDKLKGMYYSYIDAIKRMTADTVEMARGKGIATIYQLLVSHPEQEETLLQILVNKLGDPAKKLASRALFYLNKLLYEHPRMKRVVVEEVERLLFRNNISKRAQYYGVCFLTGIDLKEEHASLAHKLVTVYIAFFKACVKTGDIDTKMMSGLLTGINRAFPQAKEFGFQFTENLDTLYKIVQLSQFTISVQALCILFQILDVEHNVSGADRFYRALYEKLNAPEFKTSSHNAQLLNLIFKALKADTDVNRVTGFTKRLLQICQNCSPNLACAILFLLSEVSKLHPLCIRAGNVSATEADKKEGEEDDGESSDEESENDASSNNNGPAMEKLMKFTNIKISEEEEKKPQKNENKMTTTTTLTIEDEMDQQNDKDTEVETIEAEDVKPDIKRILLHYDPHARNPRFCGAEKSLAYELISLAQHFHPSVALFAQNLIRRKRIKYDGNPMKDFTLGRFLERFSYRNAKPASQQNNRPDYQPKGLRGVPVNSDTYLATEEENIPIEEKFFYKFFRHQKDEKKASAESKIKEEEDVSDAESIDDDEFDSLMDNYFKSVKGDEDESGDEEETSSTVDFASGLSHPTSGKGRKGKKAKLEEEEGSEDDEEEDEDDDDFDDDDGDEFISMDDDAEDLEFDEEDGDFGDDEDDGLGAFEDDDDFAPIMGKRKSKPKRGDDMFAPAEQFAEMLEENADDVLAGSHTLINREKADKKQLKWEADRSHWNNSKGFGGRKRKANMNSRGGGGGGINNKKKIKKG